MRLIEKNINHRKQASCFSKLPASTSSGIGSILRFEHVDGLKRTKKKFSSEKMEMITRFVMK